MGTIMQIRKSILIYFFLLFLFFPYHLISEINSPNDPANTPLNNIKNKEILASDSDVEKKENKINFNSILLGLSGIIIGFILSSVKEIFFKIHNTKESYRFKLYEKRLQTYQEAFNIIRKLEKTIIKSNGLREDERNKNLENIIESCVDWLSCNCLYLDKNTWEQISKSLSLKNIISYYESENTDHYIWTTIQNSREAILKGIGMKHIKLGYKNYFDLIDYDFKD